MASNKRDIVVSAVGVLLEPIVRFAVGRGLKFKDFSALVKKGFITVAEDELLRQGLEPSASRLSVMTGLQRADLQHLRTQHRAESPQDLLSRVIGLWASGRRYSDRRGRSRALTYSGERSEFAVLVRNVSQDLKHHTVLFELERLGLIQKDERRVRLVTPAYVTAGDISETIRLVANDASDLLAAGTENASSVNSIPNLHAKTEYDNIPDEALPQLRNWLLEFGTKIHQECRTYLSRFDKDTNPSASKGTGQNRIALGTFSFVEKLQPEPKRGKRKR